MLLILCPISVELKYVMNRLKVKGVGLVPVHGAGEKKLYRAEKFFLGQGGYGKVEYALGLQKVLLKYSEITKIICLGCAGSLSSAVAPFDLVVGSKTIEHDFTEKFDASGSLPSFNASQELLDKFNNIQLEGIRVHYGAIASGDEDIMTAERAQVVQKKTQALAVAWEGAGGARASRSMQKEFLEIRAITDICSSDTGNDFIKNLQKAMENAVDVLLRVL